MSKCFSLQNVFEDVEITDELEVIKGLGGSTIHVYLFNKPNQQLEINAWFEDEKTLNSKHIKAA